MKYKLKLNMLQPGDIILVGYNDELSREIQARTDSRFSHAMLYWRDSIIHASDIVITENPSRMLFDADESVCVLRLKEAPENEFRKQEIIKHARSFVGTLYDTDALNALNNGEKPFYNPNRQMCSKFVAQCYDYACLDLVEDSDTCSPQDLYESQLVDRYEDVLTEANERDIEFANSKDVTQLQFRAIFLIIGKLRKKFPQADIMSLTQLEDFIAKHPESSEEVLGIMRSSGYFDLWKKEKEYCPYLYDKDLFKEFWGHDSINKAFEIISLSKQIIAEKENDIVYYKEQMASVGDLSYYKEMLSLRENIVANERMRIDVAEKVLLDNHIVRINI